MKIAQVSLIPKGGAWIAASRINTSVQKFTLSNIYALEKSQQNPASKIGPRIDHTLSNLSKAAMTQSLFRTKFRDTEFAELEKKIRQYQIVNLHWMPGEVSNAMRLSLKSKRIFWTLHDMNPLTGYCHHAFNCSNFEILCKSCPQALPILSPVVAKTHNKKFIFAKQKNITFIAPSLWIANLASKSAVSRESRILHIPNPVPIHVFDSNIRLLARKKKGITDGKICIGILGQNYIGDKGAEIALEVVFELMKIFPDLIIPFVIGSDHPQFTGMKVEVLKQDAEESDVAEFLASMDFLIYTSKADTFPNLLIEAQSSGVPIIAWRVGGIGETFRDQHSGILTDHGKSEIFAAAKSLLENRSKMSKFGYNARNFAVCNFSYEIVGKKYVEAYASSEQTNH